MGGICWYCYWGWPRPVREIYDRACADVEEASGAFYRDPARRGGEFCEPELGEAALNYGPAHVVWDDENWDSAAWCLAECDNPRWAHWHPPILEIVRRSLRELMALPEGQVEVCPGGYDGERPEDYPPPPGVEMVKK